MSYPAQITILSMRHDTTLPPTLKQTYKSISKVHKLIRVHTHTHTKSTNTGQTHLHGTHTHWHPNILSELLWHPDHMCDVAAVSLKIKLGYSDLTVCSAKLCINTHTTAGFNDLSCLWNNSLLLKRIWGEKLPAQKRTDLIENFEYV